MACKFLVKALRPLVALPPVKSVPRKIVFPQTMTIRYVGKMLPDTQYDIPFPEKMRIATLLRKNWELIPIFGVTLSSITLLTSAILWSFYHKVDVVYKTHSRDNLSRSMSLLKPSCHKVITIEQTYTPWHEMHKALDKMHKEECRKAEYNTKTQAA